MSEDISFYKVGDTIDYNIGSMLKPDWVLAEVTAVNVPPDNSAGLLTRFYIWRSRTKLMAIRISDDAKVWAGVEEQISMRFGRVRPRSFA